MHRDIIKNDINPGRCSSGHQSAYEARYVRRLRLVASFVMIAFRKDPEILNVAAMCGIYRVFHG